MHTPSTQTRRDDFDDGVFTGWTTSGAWSAAGGELTSTVSSSYRNVSKSNTEGNLEVRFSYRTDDTSSSALQAYGDFRQTDGNNLVRFQIRPDTLNLTQRQSGVSTTLDINAAAAPAAGTWYDVRIVANGFFLFGGKRKNQRKSDWRKCARRSRRARRSQ